MVLTTVIVVPIIGGAIPMWIFIHPPCGPSGKTPADYGLKYQEVTIPASTGERWRGFFMPGTKDATIISPTAYGGDRGGGLYESALLAQAGYNVLTIESVVCAGRSVHSLGYVETSQIGDALAYLNHNTDGIQVNMSRIAMLGFSSAGASSIMAAPRYPEIAAVVAEGNYYNIDAYLSQSQSEGFFDALIVFGARLTYRLSTGQDSSVASPINSIGKIPPRPIYLIYGSLEAVRGGAQQEADAVLAADPNAFVKLWIVPGSEHGGYTFVVGAEEYKRHVVPFYDCALFQQCDAWNLLWKSS